MPYDIKLHNFLNWFNILLQAQIGILFHFINCFGVLSDTPKQLNFYLSSKGGEVVLSGIFFPVLKVSVTLLLAGDTLT